MKQAVLLVAHGTIDDPKDLPAFLRNIRQGHEAPLELVRELERRYAAIGGSSPLNAINARIAVKLEAQLGVPVRLANRLWNPYPEEILGTLDIERVVVLPLAQHSASVYVQAVEKVAHVPVVGVSNWGQTPALLDAFARRVRDSAFGDVLVLSAHSLPKAVVARGDAYEREVRASAEGVAARVRDIHPDVVVAFQSQGASGGDWLGPDLPTTFDTIAARGKKSVLVAPLGFLADHVEILYDIDIEAQQLAAQRGLRLQRTRSLDDASDFIDVLAGLATPLLETPA